MKTSAIIITTLLTISTIIVISLAIALPTNHADRPTTNGNSNNTDQIVTTSSLPPIEQFEPLFNRNWQTWKTVTRTRPVTQNKPRPAQTHQPRYQYLGAFLHYKNSVGIFQSPTKKRLLAAVGDSMGKGANAVKVIEITASSAVLEFRNMQYTIKKIELPKIQNPPYLYKKQPPSIPRGKPSPRPL